MNTVVDEWVGLARKGNVGTCKQYFYPESGVMVKLPDKGYVYGDICKWVMEEINQHAMIKYLFGKNKYWTLGIFDTIDWKAIDACMTKMAKQSGSMLTNTLKLVHGWQNNRQQKELLMRTAMISCDLMDVDRLRHVCTFFSAQPGTYNPATLSGGGGGGGEGGGL